MITADFATGTASVRSLPIGAGNPGLGNGGYQIAIDPATHTAAIATSCQFLASVGTYRAELTLLDLSSGQLSRVFQHSLGALDQFHHGFSALVGGDSATIGIDSVNHLILQRSMFCPQLVGQLDMNARPCLNEYDEGGRLVKTVPNLFSNGFIDFGIVFNGVNGGIRTGIASGQEPYGDPFVESFDVQPYTY